MPYKDLFKNYPKTEGRKKISEERLKVTEEERNIARQFGEEYFDGPRKLGLGGYYYDPKYFKPVVKDFINFYSLSENSKILDVGCAKGFMLHDFLEALPECKVSGIDISQYCIDNAIKTVKKFCQVGTCDNLPYEDNSFDLVISIATIHNLEINGVKKSIKEIMRVSKNHAYIKVNAHESESERIAFSNWNLVAKTSLYTHEWENIFNELGYNGEYSWFKP